MTELALIRHGSTAWNETGRVQGRTDVPLSPAGRAQIARWVVPPRLARFDWVTSPSSRALETARLLGAADAATERRLAEMDWGTWEGRTLEDLRLELGPEMVENETRGLDFHAAGGESPRQLQARLIPWLVETARRGRPTIAITHKGVIRAVLALASGWDMTGKPPVKLDWASAHLFTLDGAGKPQVARLNIPLEAS